MNHYPTLGDAAADIRRAIYASFSDDGLHSKNATMFLNHALEIIEREKQHLRPSTRRDLSKALSKALNPKLPLSKRQEDLLMISTLLQPSISSR